LCVHPLFSSSSAETGLPEGLFSNQKYQFGGLRLENVDIFYGNLEYFMDKWDISDHLVYFLFIWYIFPVLVSSTKKNLATLRRKFSNPKRKKKFPLHLMPLPFGNRSRIGGRVAVAANALAMGRRQLNRSRIKDYQTA
jgi:hypothetical protein